MAAPLSVAKRSFDRGAENQHVLSPDRGIFVITAVKSSEGRIRSATRSTLRNGMLTAKASHGRSGSWDPQPLGVVLSSRSVGTGGCKEGGRRRDRLMGTAFLPDENVPELEWRWPHNIVNGQGHRSVHLKMVTMVKCMLRVFYHNKVTGGPRKVKGLVLPIPHPPLLRLGLGVTDLHDSDSNTSGEPFWG